MKLLQATSGLSEIQNAASILCININYDESEGKYSLESLNGWIGGGFGRKSLIESINQEILTTIGSDSDEARSHAAFTAKIEEENAAWAEAQEENNFKLKELNKRSTRAAVLNEAGRVIGSCQTDVKSGDYVTLAYRGNDDQPINTTKAKVSRSQKNLKAADRLEQIEPFVFDGAIYYAN